MRRPVRPTTRPDVIDLKARRRAAELQKQALRGVNPRGRRPNPSSPGFAWAILFAAAVIWALLRWLPQAV